MKPVRYLADALATDARKTGKIAFISGPRQVGKTTLAKSFLRSPDNYHNWDDPNFQRTWSKNVRTIWEAKAPGPLVLDEIHKDRRWKTKLKGMYDAFGADEGVLVTGSARLDLYRKGGDSLLGRFLPYRLHPFSVAESEKSATPDLLLNSTPQVQFPWKDLIHVGTFPEPLFQSSREKALRWSRLRQELLIREDARDIQGIQDINAFQVLSNLLVPRAGQLLSINSLREDLGNAYGTVKSWFQALESIYYCFTIRPFSKSIKRSLKAEPKLYLYDTLQIPIENSGAVYENLAALHLLKACHFWTDTAAGHFELFFIRDKEKREVDFLVTWDKTPWLMIECKSNDKSPSPHLIHFTKILKPKHSIQLVAEPDFDREYPAIGVRVMSYEKFFSYLV